MNRRVNSAGTESRPAEVTRAVRLLWLTAACGLLRLVLEWKQFVRLNEDAIAEDVSLAVAFVILGFLIWKTGQGCAEARFALLALYACAVASCVMTLDLFASPSGFIISLIELYPCYLLLTSPSRRWFAALRRTTDARPGHPGAPS